MENNHVNRSNSLHKSYDKDNGKRYFKQLFQVLFKKPMSRRMAATSIGFPDQTYMVTQFVNDWIRDGKAQVIGKIKCERSGRFVDKITTNPKLFIKTINPQLTLF